MSAVDIVSSLYFQEIEQIAVKRVFVGEVSDDATGYYRGYVTLEIDPIQAI